MTTTLRIIHTTGYDYSDNVTDSFNEVRMSPLYTAQQLIRERSVNITPKPWSYEFIDYWGTHVTSFELHESHRQLMVRTMTTLDVDAVPSESTDLALRPAGPDQGVAEFADRWNEFLALSPATDPGEDMRREVAAVTAEATTVDEAALAIGRMIYDSLEYESGSTEVTGTAADAWASKKGVCQDYAHLMVGALRSIGVPARYVSGYMMPREDAPVGETVEAESHAWVQWYNGGGDNGWYSFDPTNDRVPGEFHVMVGIGRDYFDVPPLKGMFTGAGTSEMFVSVRMTRLA
jgi:transglutaminase-like putative cysteine protease